jgi:hypothetical protein
MSTMSNFRAERRRTLAAAAVAAALTACALPVRAQETVPPDAPRPAHPARPAPPAPAAARQPRPIEIRVLRVGPVRGDSLLRGRASQDFLERASAGAVIDVTTAEPFGAAPRSDAPVLFLDGRPLLDTWPVAPNRLVAVVPDARALRAGGEVTAGWLSDPERSRSRRPVRLTPEMLVRPQ